MTNNRPPRRIRRVNSDYEDPLLLRLIQACVVSLEVLAWMYSGPHELSARLAGVVVALLYVLFERSLPLNTRILFHIGTMITTKWAFFPVLVLLIIMAGKWSA